MLLCIRDWHLQASTVIFLAMSKPQKCPECGSEDIYEDRGIWNCPICSHEWTPQNADAAANEPSHDRSVVRDVNGNVLVDGDSVVVIKELKIKGAKSVVKAGTKVKNIRLGDQGDGHDISCKIDGIGAINLKSEFVRKA